jgi:DNA polymerase-3 subunit delta
MGRGTVDLKEFKKKITSGDIPAVCLFYGEEDYLKDSYLEMIKKRIVVKGTEQFNSVVIDEIPHVEKIRNACHTLPVFADRKLVVVRDSGLFRKSGKKPAGAEELPDIIKEAPQHTCLVFMEKDIDKRLQSVTAVKKNGVVIEFQYQKPAVLAKWVVSALKEMGRTISHDTAVMLVEYSDQRMYSILGEMHKLVLYTEGSDRIKEKDIRAVCTRSIKSRVFDLTDAVAAKDLSRVLKNLDEMIMLKEQVPRILYLIAMQARQLLQAKILQREGVSQNETAARLKVHPYIASKIIRQSEGFGENELKDIIKKCLDADHAIKTGQISDRTAAELLLSDIASS